MRVVTEDSSRAMLKRAMVAGLVLMSAVAVMSPTHVDAAEVKK